MIIITVAGRLTRDAEVRYTDRQDAVAGFTVAADIGYGDRRTSHFFNCSLWGKRGESVAPYLKKGMAVTVMGELNPREYDRKDGGKGISLDVRVSELTMQSSRSEMQQVANQDDRWEQEKPSSSSAVPAPPSFPKNEAEPSGESQPQKADNLGEDDIPF